MSWITLLLQASILFCLLYGLYWLLLRNDTHYQLNRLILLGIILATICIPLLPFPNSIIQFQPEVDIAQQLPPVLIHPAKEVLDFETNIVETPVKSFHINWLQLLVWTYWTGVIIFGVRFLFQVFCMVFLMQNATFSRLEDCYIAQSKLDFQPFSFFNIIFINDEYAQSNEEATIIQHEMIHAKQWHSMDIILSEFFAILFWFHPMMLILKRHIRLNLEYLVDAEMLDMGADRKSYQYSLLKTSTGKQNWHLSNNFNHSFIKKRIIMMNSKKSPDTNKLKVLFFLPLLASFYLFVNVAQAQSNEKPSYKSEIQERMLEAELAQKKAKELSEKAKEMHEKAEMTETQVEELEARAEALEAEAEAMEADAELMKEEARVLEEKLAEKREMEMEMAEVEAEMAVAEAEMALAEAEIAEEEAKLKEELAAFEKKFDSKGENIYVVIRADLERDDLEFIQSELKKNGISFKYNNIEYNDDGLLTKIGVTVKTDNGFSGNAYSYNNGGPIDNPIIFYHTPGKESLEGLAASMRSELPDQVRKLAKKMTGYFKGTFN